MVATLTSTDTPINLKGGAAFDAEKTVQITKSRWESILRAADEQGERSRKDNDKFVRQYKDGTLRGGKYDTGGGQGNIGTMANRGFSYVNVMMAILYSQSPNIDVQPRGFGAVPAMPLIAQLQLAPNDEVARQMFADCLRQVMAYSYDETRSGVQNKAWLFEGIVRGLGYAKVGWDAARGLDTTDTLRRDEVYADPHARTHLSQGRYVIHTAILPIEQARVFFAAMGVPEIEPNYKFTEGEGITGTMARQEAPSQDLDCYKFQEAWAKEEDGRHALRYYDGKTKELLLDTSWPFVLEGEDFPFIPLHFNSQHNYVNDAFSDLYEIEDLRRVYEEMVEYQSRHVKRSIAKKVVVDESVFDPDKQKQLMNPRDMEFVAVKIPPGKSLADCFSLIEFNSETDTAQEMRDQFKETADEITGMDEVIRGGTQRKFTATQSEIADEYAKLRIGRRQNQVDDALTTQIRMRAQIARQLMDPEKVAKIAGLKAKMLWTLMAGDIEDLTSEYSIGIQAGSAGQKAKAERISRFMRMFDRGIVLNQQSGYAVVNLPMLWEDIFRADDERVPEKYILPPPPPMPMPPPGAQGSAPGPEQPPAGPGPSSQAPPQGLPGIPGLPGEQGQSGMPG